MGAVSKDAVSKSMNRRHELARWADVPRLSWVTSYAFSTSHLGAVIQTFAGVCSFPCTLVGMAISYLTGWIYTNRDRTACVAIRRGGLFRLGVRVGLTTFGLTIMLSLLAFIFPIVGKATLAVVTIFLISVACFLVSHFLMAGFERFKGPRPALPNAKTSHSGRCPDGRPALTITSLASVKHMEGVLLCVSLLQDPTFDGCCLRTTARTASLARGYRRAGFSGASPRNPKDLYKH